MQEGADPAHQTTTTTSTSTSQPEQEQQEQQAAAAVCTACATQASGDCTCKPASSAALPGSSESATTAIPGAEELRQTAGAATECATVPEEKEPVNEGTPGSGAGATAPMEAGGDEQCQFGTAKSDEQSPLS